MTKRIISLLVLVVMMVSMLPVTAHAEEVTYIESIGIAKHESSASSAKKALTDAGFTVIDQDLNAGCNTLINKTDYIYLGYKRTSDPSKAITGLLIYSGSYSDVPYSRNRGENVTLYLHGGTEPNDTGHGIVDLNAGCGKNSDYIYLYVTRDRSYGSPLTDLAIRTGKGNTSLEGYSVIQTLSGASADLNEGAGGDYIYLFEKRFPTYEVTLNKVYYDKNYGTNQTWTKYYFSDHTMTSEAYGYSTLPFTYKGTSWSFVGFREDDTAGVPTLAKNFKLNYLSPSVIWVRQIYKTTSTLRFNANGGSNAPGSLSGTRYMSAAFGGLKETSLTFTIPSRVPTHPDKCAFLGWAADSNATAAQYQPGDQLTMDSEVTLYAVWQDHTYESGWSGDGTNHWKECSLCGAKIEEAAHTYTDGVCDVCGAYQSAPEVNETYEISTANQLFWFAQEVNSGNTAINGKLVADIDLEGREWVPIGSQSVPFTGTFDGQDHAIRNFKMTITEGGFYGLFGCIRDSVVRNFSISGEMVIDQPQQLELYCGVIGKAAATNADCTVENVHSSVNVKIRDGYNKNCVAGIIGNGEGKSNSPWYKLYIRRCSYSGTMDFGDAYVDCGGGIMGYGNYHGAIYISQCQFSGKILSDSAAGGQVGGIMGYNRGQNLRIHGCLSMGQIEMANAGFTGALAGRYLVTGTDFFSNKKAWNNYYTGDLAPFSNNTDTSASYNNIDIVDYEQYQSSKDSIACHVTDAQLASGEVAYLLRQNYGSASLYGAADWGQTIGVDAQPVLGGARVYYGYTTCDQSQTEKVYTNEQTVSDKPAHSCGDDNICDNCGFVCAHTAFADGVCTVCGYVCTHDTFVDGECPCGEINGGYCGAEEDGKNLTWTLADGVLTIKGEGAMCDYSKSKEIPWAESRGEIQTVVIEEGVTTLSKYAFAYFSKLTEVQIPNSVESIGYGTFGECSILEQITIPEKVTVIPEKAFFNSEKLKSVRLEGKVTTIGDAAFLYCSELSEIVLPDSVEAIGGEAFYQTKLVELVIPESVKSIGSEAFAYCSELEEVTWLAEGEVTLGESVFTGPENIDLLLARGCADQVTDSLVWNGCTFKSIQVLCSDDTLNHVTEHTDNGDGTHHIDCDLCGYVTDEAHRYTDGLCACGNAQMTITRQPASFEGLVGDMATFTVEAEGKGLSYQWFFSKDGGETWEKSSCTKNSLSVEFKAYRLNYQYRCEINDADGDTLVSDAAVLAAQEMDIVILTQPENYVGAVNDEVTFTVEATGNGLTYEWFFSTDYGETWAKSYTPGYMTNILAPILRAYRDNYMYKCVVTDVLGNSVESEAVSMTVKTSNVVIVTQPKPVVNAISGELYGFSVVAEGDNLTYRWELSTDGGETWQESWNQGYNTPNLSVRMNPNRDGNLYRCAITSGQKIVAYSDAVVLDMQDPSVKLVSQSDGLYITAGTMATFTVEAEGMDLTYLWYRSNDKGNTWTQTYLSGYNTNTLSFSANANRAAMYMCKITDGSGKAIWSEPVKLQVLSAELKILTQPVSTTCAAGETVTFTVEAQGDSLKYQWYSFDGAEWKMSYLPGYNTDTFSFEVNANRASKSYKCIITDVAGNTVETNAVNVTIG